MSLKQERLYLSIYEAMLSSRQTDIIEAELVNSGEANFLASSEGHEGAAALNPFLIKSDYLHVHYRDKALMMARGMTFEDIFYGALCKDESSSHGRQMVSHTSAPHLNMLSLVGPIGNGALHTVGIAKVIKNNTDNPIVISALGDGSSQQGEVLEAIAESHRSELPVLFFIHDNKYAISTETTGKTFFSLLDNDRPTHFHGVPITYMDGARPLEIIVDIESLIEKMRISRQPHIIVFEVERLGNHSNADDQSLYRSQDEIAETFSKKDPIKISRDYLIQIGVSEDELYNLEAQVIQKSRSALNSARLGKQPEPIFTALSQLPDAVTKSSREYRGDFTSTSRLNMLEAMRNVFDYQLSNNENVYLLGEDIEDPKGDVFGITKGLSTKYPGRVENSALTESTILGMSVGMALVGKKPVAFMQFADFMPLAYNQIATELAMMHWRTGGGWNCPVIVFAACGAYRPGLGPYHSQTNEATYANIPGIDVYMPSNASDAAGMLNAAFSSTRPSIFLYPKKLLNNGSNEDTTSDDIAKQLVPIGKLRIVRNGSDVTLIGYGNTVEFCTKTAESLETVGIDAEVIDLRTISPLDIEGIIRSVNKTKHLIVVHEDNKTCGIASEIITLVTENSNDYIKCRRVTRSDTFTPCNFKNQLEILPTYDQVLDMACEMLNIQIEWEEEVTCDEGMYKVEVIGASPSDESVTISELHVAEGDEVSAGDPIADTEASKSAGEILAPVDGVVESIHVTESDLALVGSPLVTIRLTNTIPSPSLSNIKRTPTLSRKQTNNINNNIDSKKVGCHPVGMLEPIFKTGSRLVLNDELLKYFPEKTNDDIESLTGISQRYWLSEGEDIVTLAADSALELLEKNNLHLSDIDAIICATCSPDKYVSPSMACLILNKLYAVYGEQAIQAYDINAACSGYIYAVQQAKDFLQVRPQSRVLLITAEALSDRLNTQDFDTAFLFGDAASSSLLVGNDYINSASAIVNNTHLSSIAEDGSILNIPSVKPPEGAIELNGRKLFPYAVKNMSMSIHKCCDDAGISLSEIDLVVPHQANQRISSAIEKRLKMKKGSMYSNIAKYGNTSSCTIPIALSETIGTKNKGDIIALCAFGSGFTSGSALLRKL